MLSLGIISGLVNLAGTGVYIAAVLQKRSSPERATWFIWLLMGSVAFLSQAAIGAHDSLWFVGLQTVGVAIVALLSLKYGEGGFSRNDSLLILLALTGIITWLVTDNALFSLVMVVIVRAIGVTATVIKTYSHPRSETALPWLLYAVSAVLAMLSVGKLNFELLLYPVYVLTADFAVMFAKYHRSLQVARLAQEFASYSHLESQK